MSSIDTNAHDSIRFSPANAPSITPATAVPEASTFFGRTRIGDSPPVRVDRTPRATDVTVHPGRSEPVTPISPGSKLDDLVDDYKLAVVYQALAQSGGNHRRAAALIGIHRSSFTRMLHRLEGAKRDREHASEALEGPNP